MGFVGTAGFPLLLNPINLSHYNMVNVDCHALRVLSTLVAYRREPRGPTTVAVRYEKVKSVKKQLLPDYGSSEIGQY